MRRTVPPCPVSAAFNKAVDDRMAKGMTRTKAIAAIARDNPELHTLFIQTKNRHRPAAVRNSRFAG